MNNAGVMAERHAVRRPTALNCTSASTTWAFCPDRPADRGPDRHACQPGGTVSGRMARIGRLDFDDLMHTRFYERWSVYRRASSRTWSSPWNCSAGWRSPRTATLSIAARPGFASTNLQKSGPALDGFHLPALTMRLALPFAQPAGPAPCRSSTPPRRLKPGPRLLRSDGLGQLSGGPGRCSPLRPGPGTRPGDLAQRLGRFRRDLPACVICDSGSSGGSRREMLMVQCLSALILAGRWRRFGCQRQQRRKLVTAPPAGRCARAG